MVGTCTTRTYPGALSSTAGLPAATSPSYEGDWRRDWPLDLRRALSPHQRSAGDPTLRYDQAGAAWRTTTTPAGPAPARIPRVAGQGRIAGWAPGAGWPGSAVPRWLGAADRP